MTLLSSVVVIAQNSIGSLYGKICDSTTRQTLSFATISVYRASDTSLLTYRLSDLNGKFQVPGIPFNVKCRLLITFSGYGVYRNEFELSPTQVSLDLDTVFLVPDIRSLDEIIVQSERPPVIFNKDTIEFNANAFKTLPTALVEDLLKKLPGVQVDENGSIRVNGRPVNKIMIDGKDFFSGDPKMATRNLPANLIDKVQVTNDQDQIALNPDLPLSSIGQVINLKFKRYGTGIKDLCLQTWPSIILARLATSYSGGQSTI